VKLKIPKKWMTSELVVENPPLLLEKMKEEGIMAGENSQR
jgi:hypothetical protein